MIGSFARQAASGVSLLLHRVLPRRVKGSVGILLYHRITDVVAGLPEPTLNVTPAAFRRQLAGLKSRGAHFMKLREASKLCEQGGELPDNATVVTFDDGYENVYLNAWPILEELEIPAAIFVSTAQLNTDQPFSCDRWGRAHQADLPRAAYRPLQHSQCREMIAGGLIEIGAHTHTHADFRGRPEALHADLVHHIAYLRREFWVEHVPFAFPYGRVSLGFACGELKEAARRAGVDCALTTECVANRPGDDPFSWGRFNVYERDTPATLEAKLAGWYGWAPKLQDMLCRFTARGQAALRSKGNA